MHGKHIGYSYPKEKKPQIEVWNMIQYYAPTAFFNFGYVLTQ
jgi:hypothetical protein